VHWKAIIVGDDSLDQSKISLSPPHTSCLSKSTSIAEETPKDFVGLGIHYIIMLRSVARTIAITFV
jgi:hypothetical protein